MAEPIWCTRSRLVNMYSLIVYPLPSFSEEVEKNLITIVNKTSYSAYDLRQKLLGVAPTLFKRSGDQTQLTTMAAAINEVGVSAVCVADDDVRKVSAPLRAHSLIVEDRRITFKGVGQKQVVIPSSESLVLVIGNLSISGDDQMRTMRRISKYGEGMEGNQRLKKMAQGDPVADIYLLNSGHVVRVMGKAFNYAGLDLRLTESTPFNFLNLIDLLRLRSLQCHVDLGFGLSTIPDCLPGPGRNDKELEENLRAFTRYSRILFVAYQRGLRSPTPEPVGAEMDQGRMADQAPSGQSTQDSAEQLSIPPSDLSLVKNGLAARMGSDLTLMQRIQSLGPAWLMVPLMVLCCLLWIGGMWIKSSVWIQGGFASLGMVLVFHGIELYARKRLIEDTPTSRIHSMPMGFVEIIGKARQKYLLKLPYLLLDCVYFRYRMLERREIKEGGAHWVVTQSGSSGPVPFYVEDDTGMILVDPKGAIIGAVQHQEVSGAAAIRLGGMALTEDQKVIIDYIPEGFTTYVYGMAEPLARTPEHSRQRILKGIRDLKKSPERLSQYDRNQDGRIDDGEWAEAMEDIRKQVAREDLSRDLNYKGSVQDVVIHMGRRAGRFLIRGEDESEVVWSLRFRMRVYAVLGMIVFIISFASMLQTLGIG